MTPPPTDDLGALLRTVDPDTRGDGSLPDDGFTARTLARLPRARGRLRGLVLASAGALALLVALLAGAPPDAGLAELIARAAGPLSGEGWLVDLDLDRGTGLGPVGLLAGLFIAAIALVVARDELT